MDLPNTKGGNSRPIELEPTDWTTVDWEDIAAVDITDRLLRGKDDISYIPRDMLVTEEFIKNSNLGLGEDGFMLGLFTSHPGEQKNMIASRFGNIALLADSGEPIWHGMKKTGPSYTTACHIFDLRSRPGFWDRRSLCSERQMRTFVKSPSDISHNDYGWKTIWETINIRHSWGTSKIGEDISKNARRSYRAIQ